MKDLSVKQVKQIAYLDFIFILFFEIKTIFFGNVLLVCLLHFLQ